MFITVYLLSSQMKLITHPVEDTFGMMTAVVLLNHSLNTGINAAMVQFKTFRKTRSAMSNYERTTAPAMRHADLAGYKKGERLGFTNTSVYSLWFDRFIVGCHVRMGDDTRQDRAFSIELILAMQNLWKRTSSNARPWRPCSTFYCMEFSL
jgi:hypothetical protein